MHVHCLECREEMTLVSLEVHLQAHYGTSKGGRQHQGTTAPGREPLTYKMAFPTVRGTRNCPAEGCWGQAVTWTAVRVQFFHRHVQDTVIILD